ncbi:MAG: M36 family metallopeptidase, partial [Acidobacteria bacterium]|nr:M36 family metallopeptidase [Acidobacteriota bacterium]
LEALGLNTADLTEYETTDVVVNRATGSTHVYLRQLHGGVPVYDGQLQINVNRNGRVLSVNNAFQPALAQGVNTLTPKVRPEEAALRAAEHLAIANPPLPAATGPPRGVQQVTPLEAPGISAEPLEARLMLLPIRRGEVRLVWNFQIHTVDQEHVYDLTVDAESGEVWTRIDWVASDQYRVYPAPVESPNHTAPAPPADGRTLVSNPADGTASPFGWHDTNGAIGPEFTNMRGNNVHAYDDQDRNNTPPASEPNCGPSLVCDFPIDLSADPTATTAAAVANLFHWNNLIHDVQYQYGFTEAAGNFQVNNYGRGGLGNDDVRAEAQDGGGTNNANFFTPRDGLRPRMQMYLWTATTPRRDGDFDNGIVVHEYGHGISNRLVGGPSNVSCLGNAQQPGEGLSDWWALAYTAKTGDAGTTGRGVGTYALGQATTGPGIRTQRYSTDPAINTWTYASISGMAIPHGVGSVWAQAAWEMYWALVDAHGFSADLYNAAGTAGNQRAMLYVNEGLMNTVCRPAFTDVRDGIIQAAADNHGGEDVCLLWRAFASFGLGANAVSGGPTSTTPKNGFGVALSCLPDAPSISIGDAVVSEGNSGVKSATFPLTLSAPSALDVTVDYRTADITVVTSAANAGILSIPSVGAASPYPSTITVPPGVGRLVSVRVKINQFSHTFPADVDVLLVGPGGQSVVLMSDVGGGTDVTDVNLTFDDTGPALGSGALAPGTYRPTNISGGDSYPAPAPAGPYGSALFVFNGTDSAGTWKLFVVDDGSGDAGSFSGGWSLELAVLADGAAGSTSSADTEILANNAGLVSIPSAGAASPYPATITVPPGVGPVINMTVKLNQFSHTWPADVDVLLVGPGGQGVVLLSDAGGSTPVTNVDFTFNDSGPLLTGGTLTSGTYKPTNISSGAADSYPSPAPTGPYGSALSVFNGTDPAGTWKLFVVDDTSGDAGSFSGGWSIGNTTGTDYTPASGTLTFSGGTTSQNLNVSVVGDTAVEVAERFVVNLSNAGNASVADAQAMGTILNDDGLTFSDDPIVPRSTLIKAAHILQLRSRIDLVRQAKGLAPFAWSYALLTPGKSVIRAPHIVELRTALGQVYAAEDRSQPTYTDPALNSGSRIRAVHISELRAAVIAIE